MAHVTTPFKFNKEEDLTLQYEGFLNSLDSDQFNFYLRLIQQKLREEKFLLKMKMNELLEEL